MRPTVDDLMPYVERGHVSRVDQGQIAIFNYTERCTFDRAWDAVTLAARGLVLNVVTGEPVALGFPKFFNHGEPSAWRPDRDPEITTVKHDGSLGILYRLGGRVRWTTRGSFYSTQASVAERLWAERWAGVSIPDPLTPLVEIVGPETRNIVRYDEPDLILLGIRNRFTGADLGYEEVCDWAGLWGMAVTERVGGGLTDLVDRARAMNHTEEGFVLRWGDHRLKVKSVDYLRVAKLIAGMSDRFIADIWYAGRSDLLVPVPEEFRAEAEAAMLTLDAEAVAMEDEFAAAWARVESLTDRKAVADVAVPGSPMFSAVMQRFSGRVPDLRMLVYRRRFDGKPRAVGTEE